MRLLSIKKSFAVASIALVTASFATSALAMQGHDKGKHGEVNVTSSTKSATMMNYSSKKFQRALSNGDMIIVDIYKDGCPVCARQHPILEKATSLYPNAKFFRINYDKDKQAVKKFRAGSQSTIIVFNNKKEINRSVGQVKEEALLAQFEKGVKADKKKVRRGY
ncbi:MAG TPA: hypothetical protein DCL21_03185 [Alphaproteobacteria bacterium]|nr:hypothetical protein [Alphaproteobacteria bacterium]